MRAFPATGTVKTRSGAPCPARREAGLHLIEVTVASGILLIAIVGALGTLFHARRVKAAVREKLLAQDAARAVLEKLRGERLEDVYALYNEDPVDDPTGAGKAPGPWFDVEGLTAPPGRRVGRVLFPENGSPKSLREDVRNPAFGMPAGMDLNRDGRIDSAPHASDYKILPVRIVLEWKGLGGEGRLERSAFLTRK